MTVDRFTAEGIRLTNSPHELTPGVLTPRQRQIVDLYLNGMSAAQIARHLALSIGTINPTLKASARRMGITSIARPELRRARSKTQRKAAK